MRNSLKFFVLAAITLCFAFALPKKENNKKFVVLIDVAHGGKDTGGQFENYTEKDIALQIANKLKVLNKDKDIKLHFTRDNDVFLNLTDRVDIINEIKPDLVLSLHLNYSTNNFRKGMEFFVSDKSPAYEEANGFAEKIAAHFHQNGYTVNPVKTASFTILKNSESPAIVCELGFLSNEKDREYLIDETRQDDLANTLFDFIKKIK